jgi:hypothetical protein
MDLLEGPTLEEWLGERGALSLTEIVDVFMPIASGVCAAHDAGVIHRDLKPSNILLGPFRGGARHPVVVDFGISKLLDEEDFATRSEAILGTLPYLAPELARSPKGVGPGADQYSLGVILYECATGRRPFSGASPYELLHAIVTTSPPPPSEVDSRVPSEFDAVVARAMARDPQNRYPSVKALGSALLSFGSRRAWSVWGCEFTGLVPDSGAAATETSPELVEAGTAIGPSRTGARGLVTGRQRFPLSVLLGGIAVGVVTGASMATTLVSRTHPTLNEDARHALVAHAAEASEPTAAATVPAAGLPPIATESSQSSPDHAIATESGQAPPNPGVTAVPNPAPVEVVRPHVRSPMASTKRPEAKNGEPPTRGSTSDGSSGNGSPPAPTPEHASEPVTVGANQAPILR